MKLFTVQLILIVSIALFSVNSKASLIFDTDKGSFVDAGTQLEWMDFGINYNESYNSTISELAEGRKYASWRLPSKEEVFVMWRNAFLNIGADYENPDDFGPGEGLVIDINTATSLTVLTPTLRIMGFNKSFFSPIFNDTIEEGRGIFIDEGNAFEFYIGNSIGGTYDNAFVRSLFSAPDLNTKNESYSTLLVREHTAIDEPNIFLIIMLTLALVLSFKLKSRSLRKVK